MTDSTDVMNSSRGNAPPPHAKAELQPPSPTNGNDNEAHDSKAEMQATEATTLWKEGPSDSAFGHDATSQAVESEASGPAEDLGIANNTTDAKTEACQAQGNKYGHDTGISAKERIEAAKPAADAKSEPFEPSEHISGSNLGAVLEEHIEPATPHVVSSMTKSGPDGKQESRNGNDKTKIPLLGNNGARSDQSFLLDENDGGSASGTEEEQSTFMKELENFFREQNMEFKPPKFYGEEVNCLKLWRTVMRLGGFDKVTSCKMWRHVGDSFKPPKTCTTVSWTFRGFYEKALLDYERHKACAGELNQRAVSQSEPMDVDNQASGSGRARRDAAARAMQGWHSSRQLGSGEVSDPTIKDPSSLSLQKRGKQVKGLLKRKKPANTEDAIKPGRIKASKLLDVEVADIGTPAEWVKITVQETKDCFEVYALVPGLLREEVRVQSDPAGRLVISGEPQNPDNPWGVKPFKKIVILPSKIDPHLTSAVVTLHGQLFVRAPFAHLSS